MASKNLVRHISTAMHSMPADRDPGAGLDMNRRQSFAEPLRLPKIPVRTTEMPLTPKVHYKSKHTSALVPNSAQDVIKEGKKQVNIRDPSLVPSQISPDASWYASKFPQQSREAISKHLKDSVRVVVDTITQAPSHAEAPCRLLLLIEEWLSGDAALGFTPSVVLAGLADLVCVLSRSVPREGDPFLNPAIVQISGHNSSTANANPDEKKVTSTPPREHPMLHNLDVAKRAHVTSTKHTRLHQGHPQEVDVIDSESFLPSLVHRSRSLPSWPYHSVSAPCASLVSKHAIPEDSMTVQTQKPNFDCYTKSLDASSGSRLTEETGVNHTSTQMRTLTQMASLASTIAANNNVPEEHPHYIAESLEKVLAFCTNRLILLTLEDQRILGKAACRLFAAFSEVIAHVSMCCTTFTASTVDSSAKEETKLAQTSHQEAVVAGSPVPEAQRIPPQIVQRLHLAALRGMQSLISQLHPHPDPAAFDFSHPVEQRGQEEYKKEAMPSSRGRYEVPLAVKSTALCELADFLLQRKASSLGKPPSHQGEQAVNGNDALNRLVGYWYALLTKKAPYERGHPTFALAEDEGKSIVGNSTILRESRAGERQREVIVNAEEEVKAIVQIFEQLFSGTRDALEKRLRFLDPQKGAEYKRNRQDMIDLSPTIPVLVAFTLQTYVNSQSRLLSLCVDLLSLLGDIAPSATSRSLFYPTPLFLVSRPQEGFSCEFPCSVPFDSIFHAVFSLLTMPHSQTRLELLNDMLLFLDSVLGQDTNELMKFQRTAFAAKGSVTNSEWEARNISPQTIDAINACMLVVFYAVCKEELIGFSEYDSLWNTMNSTLSSFCAAATSKQLSCSTSTSRNGEDDRKNTNEPHSCLTPIDTIHGNASGRMSVMLQRIRLPRATTMSCQELRRELLYLKQLGWQVLEQFMEWQSAHVGYALVREEMAVDGLTEKKGAIYEGYYLLNLCWNGFLDVLFLYLGENCDLPGQTSTPQASPMNRTISLCETLSRSAEDLHALRLVSWELLTDLVNHTQHLREILWSVRGNNFFLEPHYPPTSENSAYRLMNESKHAIRSARTSLACVSYDYNFDEHIVSMGGICSAVRCLDAYCNRSSRGLTGPDSEDLMIPPQRLREPLSRVVLSFLTSLSHSRISGGSVAEEFSKIPHLHTIVINSLQGIRSHYNLMSKRPLEESPACRSEKNFQQSDRYSSGFFLPGAALDTALTLLDLLKNLCIMTKTSREEALAGVKASQCLNNPMLSNSLCAVTEPAQGMPSTRSRKITSALAPDLVGPTFGEDSKGSSLEPERAAARCEERAYEDVLPQEVLTEHNTRIFPTSEGLPGASIFSRSGGVQMLLDWIQLILSPYPQNALSVAGLSTKYLQQPIQSALPPLDESLFRYGPLLASLLQVLQNFMLANDKNGEDFIEAEGMLVLLDLAESLAVGSGILGERALTQPGGLSIDENNLVRFRQPIVEGVMLESTFTARNPPLLNSGLEQFRMQFRTGLPVTSQPSLQDPVCCCKNLLAYTLTLISDLLYYNEMAQEHFMLWQSRRLQGAGNTNERSNVLNTGINAVQLLVSVWEFSLRENTASSRENMLRVMCTHSTEKTGGEKGNLNETTLTYPIAGLELLHIFIREKINLILRQEYVRRLVFRKVSLGLFPSSTSTAAPSLCVNWNADLERSTCADAREEMRIHTTLLQCYVFVKYGRWVSSKVDKEMNMNQADVAYVEDFFASEEEIRFALKETLTWLNTEDAVSANFIAEAISVWLKEHLVLGIKVYSCLSSLGFNRLVSTIVAKDDLSLNSCQRRSAFLPTTAKQGTVLTVPNLRELALTPAERSHIVAMASIPSLCIDELCLAMSTTANILESENCTNGGPLLDPSETSQGTVKYRTESIRPTTPDRHYLRSILPDVLKRSQEIEELIKMGYNLEEVHQTQELDRFLATCLSRPVSYKATKLQKTVPLKENPSNSVYPCDIAERLRKRIFSSKFSLGI